MPIKDNIPAQAILIRYNYGREKGFFHIWEGLRGKWQFSALGHCGEGRNRDEALAEARNWIINRTVKH